MVSGVIVARALGVENRGHFALLTITPVVMVQVATVGLPLAITYFIAHERIEPTRLVRSLLVLIAGLTLLMLAIHWTVLVVALRGQSDDLVFAGLATAIVAPGIVAQLLGLAILQGQQRFREFHVLRTMHLLMHGLLLACLFIAGLAELPLAVLSWSLSVLVSGAVILRLALKGSTAVNKSPATDLPSQGKTLRFGFKSLGGYVTPIETLRVDQLAAGLLLGPAALGLYVIGLSFTNLPRLIGQSIGMVAYPRIAHSGARHAKNTILRFVAAVTLSSGLLALVLAAAAGRLVPFLFGSEFADSVPVVRVLLLYSVLFSVRRVLTDSLRGLDFAGLGTIGEMASWPVLAVGLVLLPSNLGAVGVAWALVAYAATSLLIAAALMLAKVCRPLGAVAQQPDETSRALVA